MLVFKKVMFYDGNVVLVIQNQQYRNNNTGLNLSTYKVFYGEFSNIVQI